MEAEKIPHPNGGGWIKVTATREEWLEIIDQLDDGVWALNDSSEKLVNWLINQKVYG